MKERFRNANSAVFSNIGGKIITLAKIVFWGGIAASIILGIIAEIDCWFSAELAALFIIGVGGATVCCISAFFLYAFGQLVDDIHKN